MSTKELKKWKFLKTYKSGDLEKAMQKKTNLGKPTECKCLCHQFDDEALCPCQPTEKTMEDIQKLKKKIYIAMFGSNFVNVEKLVPAEDKKVEKYLTEALAEYKQKLLKRIRKMRKKCKHNAHIEACNDTKTIFFNFALDEVEAVIKE